MMGTVLAPIVTGIVSGGIIEVAKRTYDEWRSLSGEDVRVDTARVKRAVSRGLSAITWEEQTDAESRQVQEAVQSLLASADVDLLVRDAALFRLLDMPSRGRARLESALRRLLVIHGCPQSHVDIETSQLVGLLWGIAEDALGRLADENKIQASQKKQYGNELSEEQRRQIEERRRLRQERLEDLAEELRDRSMASLEDQFESLLRAIDPNRVNLASVRTKVATLRRAVAHVHGMLHPAGVESADKVPFRQRYVVPNLEFREKSISAHELLVRFRRAVILGSPGSGKTTLTSYLALQASETPDALKPLEVSFPVVLRELSSTCLTRQGIDVISALSEVARTRYQVDLTEAEARYLAATGRLLIILDGLDELLEVGSRLAVAAAVEAFSAVYPRASMICTSRKVGYDQSPLVESQFPRGEIDEFSEPQVLDYVQKWFRDDSDLIPWARRQFIERFMEESASVPDLRRNPLMLSLLCSLYRYQNAIPATRPDIYARCAGLLFDQWDRRRQLRPRFSFDAHISRATQHIAYWIFESQDRQAGVRQSDLEAVAAKYFQQRQNPDIAQAEMDAHDFIEFCRGRAWILSDTSADREGRPLFQFTHRTFLEYYTALYVIRTMRNSQIVEVVQHHCADASWNMVCQMIIQLAPRKQEGLEDRILDAVLRQLTTLSENERRVANALSLASLGNMPLTYSTVVGVVTESLNLYWAGLRGTAELQRGPIPDREYYWVDIEKVALENRQSVRAALRDRLNEQATDPVSAGLCLSHLGDVFIADGTSLAEMSWAVDERLARLAFRASQSSGHTGGVAAYHGEVVPQIRAILLMTGGRSLPELTSNSTWQAGEFLFGLRFPTGVEPLPGLWGNKAVPNGLDALLWRMVRAPLTEALISPTHAAQLVVALREAFGRRPRRGTHFYRPHPCIFWQTNVGGREERPESWSQEYVARTTVAMCASLAYIEQLREGRRERLSDLRGKDWGYLNHIPQALLDYCDGAEISQELQAILDEAWDVSTGI